MNLKINLSKKLWKHLISPDLIAILFVVINITLDIIHKQAGKYKIVIIGMGIFLLFGIIEIINFYVHSPNTFGPSISIGLIILLLMNSIQIFSDILKKFEEIQRKKQEAWINTNETIAGAIDAKDEYTGGHSERVANYAGLLDGIYHRRLSDTDVKQEIINASGKQFDPKLVKYFVQLIDRGEINPYFETLEVSHTHRQMLRSIVLEECLKKAETAKTNTIINPSHVRFACYIMKLSEKMDKILKYFLSSPNMEKK